MMSKEQEESVKMVFRNFITHDQQRGWSDIDEILFKLDFLSDEETILETETQIYRHSQGTLKCAEDHGQKACLVPQLMDCVNAICELYNESKSLHPKNRYLLHNYLAVSHKGTIYVDV